MGAGRAENYDSFQRRCEVTCGRDLEAQPRSVGEKDVQEWRRGMMTGCGGNSGVV